MNIELKPWQEVRFVTRETPGIDLLDVHGLASHYECKYEAAIGGEVYKLDVGEELNQLLDMATVLYTSNPGTIAYINACRSIAARVAEFEELDTVQHIEHAKELLERANA